MSTSSTSSGGRRAIDHQNLVPVQTTGLRWFSKLVCASTLFLIFAGGMVTSTSSGLAVPDWPLSYGMFMPPMVGGVFYEHGHRMIASMVGFLMVILTIWIMRCDGRRWVRRLTGIAMGAVVVQGLLGGLTVKMMLPIQVSVSHAMLAQTFFILTVVIAYAQSREFLFHPVERIHEHPVFWKWALGFVGLVYVQLFLGALMRHMKAGLAVPDFPTMAGSWIPSLSHETVEAINAQLWQMDRDFVTRAQVFVHLLHRAGALVVLIFGGVLLAKAMRLPAHSAPIKKAAALVGVVIAVQIGLGIATVLSIKAPIITSFHVVTGAALLGISSLCALRAFPWSMRRRPAN